MIVIPMAGLSQRFRDAGYAVPKYMLDLHGRSVFAHSVLSFERCFDALPFLFIARSEADTPAFVEAEARALGIARFRVAVLDAPTRGQADTVALGLAQADTDPDGPLTIFNIDTFRPGFRFPDAPWTARSDGWLEVMPGDDPGFSYVRPVEGAPEPLVAETAEKRVISNLASTGLYHFARTRDFLDAFTAEQARPAGPELYVAPLYNALIARGLRIHYRAVPAAEVVFCGLPAQYEALLARP